MSKVDTQHPKYEAQVNKWKRCRDTVAGSDAVKDAGTDYLPKLKDQDNEDYKAYKTRASYFNAVWRTISALSGLIFRKPPTIEVPKSVEPLLEDITMSGVSFHEFAEDTTQEALTCWAPGILVDYPQESTEGMTKAKAEAMNRRPTMQMYPIETIINWKHERINNATVLSMVVLKEEADLEGENEFEHETETRYRVLDLVKSKAGSYLYRQRLFRIKDKEDEQIGNDIFPLMNGKPLDFIPFYAELPPTEPPLIDLVDLNLTHYRTDADYRHGLHFTGLPTAWIAGYQKDANEKLYVGSSEAWVFSNPEAKAGFLEFTGQGLEGLRTALEDMKQEMAILGARLLVSEKRDAETAETAKIHKAGESSILAAIAQTISIGLTNALITFCMWAGADGDVSVELNRDFMPIGMTPQELQAVLYGWQIGAPGLSDEGLFNLLKDREMIRDDVTLEEEQARIASKEPNGALTGE